MKKSFSLLASMIFMLGFSVCGWAQLGLFSKQQLIEFTPDWHGPRFANGRPDVPTSVLQRLQDVTAEEAWEVLEKAGYHNQFESGWTVVNPQKQRLVGRVVTAVFMPYRPDLDSVVRANAKNEGDTARGENSWIINTLQPGDVMVVDLFGKIEDGTIIGANLATSVFSKSHNGIIVNGSIRDTSEIEDIHGFEVFCRGMDRTALRNVTLMGINVPIRMGKATVMPGDIAVSDPEGITFIPPQLVEKVADHAELDHLVDDWGMMMLREKKYKPGQIDGRWTPEMVEEFNKWVAETKHSKLRLKVPQ
jgi:4-hydroxy-4-methyl-2-oxoglutarate aldolase